MAFLAPVGAAISAALPFIAVVSSITSAFAGAKASGEQATQSRLQAQQAQLQGRQNALNYSRQAMQVLERQNRLAGTIRARAAAAGVDPFTGSPLSLQQVNAMMAGREAQIAQENAEMAIYGGLAQSQSLQAAAGIYEQQGVASALLSFGQTAYGLSRASLPSVQTLAPVETRTPVPVAAFQS